MAASAGDQRASLAYAVVDPANRRHRAWAGRGAAAILVGPENRLITTTDAPPLGEVAEVEFDQDQATLQPGEVLLLISGGCRKAVDGVGLVIGETPMASLVAKSSPRVCRVAGGPPASIARADEPLADDMTVLVVNAAASDAAGRSTSLLSAALESARQDVGWDRARASGSCRPAITLSVGGPSAALAALSHLTRGEA